MKLKHIKQIMEIVLDYGHDCEYYSNPEKGHCDYCELVYVLAEERSKLDKNFDILTYFGTDE